MARLDVKGRRFTAFLVVTILTWGFTVGPVGAQAWVARKGQGYLSFGYQAADVDNHIFSGDAGEGTDTEDLGEISAHSGVLALEYGLTDRLTLEGAFVYITSKYEGTFPESDIDDGSFHGEFQDAALGLRYNLVRGPLLVTPLVRVIVPTHDYETFGHSAVGRGLGEYQIGVDFAARLGQVLPDPYIQASYVYAFVEDHDEHSLDRDNAFFEFGCLFNRTFSLRTFAIWSHVRDGVDWLEIDSMEEFHSHDVAANETFWHVGVGGTFALSPTLTLYSSLSETVGGENTHDAFSFTIGMSWSFGEEGNRRRASVNVPAVTSMAGP